jgi:glutaconate CoA-transferase, subunit B
MMELPATLGNDLMIVSAARKIQNNINCFVGIGFPSFAVGVAIGTHAVELNEIYESGALGSRPKYIPRSISDSEIAQTADALVPITEIFSNWLQGDRVDLGVIGAAQVDKYGNINSTVIGGYSSPKVRLPGGGGAPEIVGAAKECFVIVQHSKKSLVSSVDFKTSVSGRNFGYNSWNSALPGKGVTAVFTDLCILGFDEKHQELVVTQIHPNVEREQIIAATGWPVIFSETVSETQMPSVEEIEVLRGLHFSPVP